MNMRTFFSLPGSVILSLGLAFYAVILFFWISQIPSRPVAGMAEIFALALGVPMMGILLLVTFPLILVWAIASGIPQSSASYAWSIMKLYWRAYLGVSFALAALLEMPR